MSRSFRSLPFLALAFCLFPPPAALAQCAACTSGGDTPVPAFLCREPGSDNSGGTQCSGFPTCQTPLLTGPFLESSPEADGEHTVRLRVGITAPRNHEQGNSAFWPVVYWFAGATAPPTMSPNACTLGAYDKASTYLERQNVTCAGGNFGTFSLRVIVCQDFLTCAPAAKREGMSFQVSAGSLPGCGPPPPSRCPEDEGCTLCLGPGSGSSPAGGGAGASPPGSGPGARLRQAAGGAGSANTPGNAAWRATLGRGWSHDHAERIVPDPDETHVWLITKFATFREFSGLSGGVYATVKPSDEYRKLHRTVAGWELRELDGAVHHFDSTGLWSRTADKNANATAGAYSGGRLASVSFPDGRSEAFVYHPGGKLASITEIGVGGSPTRTWSYTWTADDLTRIARPDGTALEFFYGDALWPGYLTRMDLVGIDTSRRVETAWEYNAGGSVQKTWKGDPSPAGPNAVELYTFSYDNPSLPALTQVTDPLGKVSTYTIARDSASTKPKVTRIEGDCPSCGLGPNSQMTYGDPAHPLRPTRTVDGRLIETQMAYNATGRLTSKTEAAGTPLARTTAWQYANPAFPELPTRIEIPSTSGGGGLRTTILSYNGTGDLTTRTIQGAEGGGSFSFSTLSTFNAAGQPLTIDPPGYAAADRAVFTYDPARGNLLPLTRTDPQVGSTTFGYDFFNRSTSLIDPNGVETVTTYDELDRVLTVTQKGATLAEDLVTTNTYNAFKDLFRTTLPRGNVVEYAYDAAGRMISIERKPDAVTRGERTFYTLDAFGHRTKEELQRWSGTAWVTESFTDSVYSSRCHLDKVVHPGGAVTEYAYDCDGNLEKVWDANHPRASNATPTQLYTYDSLNRLSAATQPWAGGGTAVTGYGYDVQDHLNRVTDAEGNMTTYSYGDRDLMTAQLSPVSGTTGYAYNEHGELVSEVDARGITTARTIDPLDRVTAVSYPDMALNISYTYDDLGVPFSKGRLTRIARHGDSVDYRYDRFGRVLQDGDLSYTYDKNGNPATIVYPGSVTAVYAYDFADRPATLKAQRPSLPDQPLVSSAGYLPSGPLSTLALGNGRTETRTFNARYFPTGITLSGSLLSWTYNTDQVGNILTIADNLNAANNRTYGYQDFHYFLTQGNGPWGTRAWSYDKIGNRLTETRGGVTDTYSYLPAPGGGRTPILTSVQTPAGTRTYQFGPAGHIAQIAAGTDSTLFTSDNAGRLARIERPSTNSSSAFLYDGRSYLNLAAKGATLFGDGFETGNVCGWSASLGSPGAPACLPPQQTLVEPSYSSEGLLHALRRDAAPERSFVFHFAGRPVAQLDLSGGVENWKYLTSDHLGTPVAATGGTGTLLWQGGFEPFGGDWSGAEGAGVFLRFPGQWADGVWAGVESGVYYNVHRWYGWGVGRYTRPDPLGLIFDPNVYTYATGRPTVYFDPLGLAKVTNKSCRAIVIKAEGGNNRVRVLKPGESADADGFFNGAVGSCNLFCDTGDADITYKINTSTDVTITGGCGQGCLSWETADLTSFLANTFDLRRALGKGPGWKGPDWFDQHPDWKPPTQIRPQDCCKGPRPPLVPGG